MQIHPGACSPETLYKLQVIFDAVWRDLERRKSSHTFPWAIQATRYTVARRILQHVNDMNMDAEGIKRDVLQSFAADEMEIGAQQRRTGPSSGRNSQEHF